MKLVQFQELGFAEFPIKHMLCEKWNQVPLEVLENILFEKVKVLINLINYFYGN